MGFLKERKQTATLTVFKQAGQTSWTCHKARSPSMSRHTTPQ